MSNVSNMVNVLMIEADRTVLQEVIIFFKERMRCRVTHLSISSNVLEFSGLEIHLQEQIVYLDHRHIPMTHYEFHTLKFLAQHLSWVLSKEQIYEAVWKEPGENCGSAVTNVISQIRKKLNGKKYIKTVVNSGYKFEV